MDTEKNGWNKATTPPMPKAAVLLAMPSLDGVAWVYEFGAYYRRGDIFKINPGRKIIIKKNGYYTFSEKFDDIIRLTCVKYWTYLDEPADIKDELIIVKEDQSGDSPF